MLLLLLLLLLYKKYIINKEQIASKNSAVCTSYRATVQSTEII